MIKKVVSDNSKDTVEVRETDEGYIYAYRDDEDVYKLHRIGKDNWTFIRLNDSVCWANGDHVSMQEAIRTNMEYDIYEFTYLADFIQWLNEQK